MVNGINFNGQNNWVLNTNTVRYNAVPTSLWSYDLSCMAPQDSLGTLNDIGLFNFDIGVNNLVNQTAALSANILPYLTAFQANISAQNQQIMSLLSRPATPNMFLNPWIYNPFDNNFGAVNNSGKISYKDKIDESDVATYIGKLGNDPKWKDALGAKIKLADGTETTILQRLVDLCHDYLTNEDPELSAEEFAQIQEIAGKYGKTGKISREDLLTLKSIIKAHSGKTEKADDAASRPDKYQAVLDNAEAGSPNNYKQLSNYFKDILYNGDATEDSLNEGTKLMDKYNVLNVVQHFKNEYGHLEEENIIDAIFADTSRWGKASAWNFLDNLTTDDAKPSVTRLSELLIERTNDIIAKNPEMADEDKKALKAKCNALNNALNNTEVSIWAWSSNGLTDKSKKAISTTFQDLADSLEKVENAIYNRD